MELCFNQSILHFPSTAFLPTSLLEPQTTLWSGPGWLKSHYALNYLLRVLHYIRVLEQWSKSFLIPRFDGIVYYLRWKENGLKFSFKKWYKQNTTNEEHRTFKFHLPYFSAFPFTLDTVLKLLKLSQLSVDWRGFYMLCSLYFRALYTYSRDLVTQWTLPQRNIQDGTSFGFYVWCHVPLQSIWTKSCV